MTTKEKIAEESLNLFSTKCFNAVSVRDIARAVGIKESSIYNHYKSKQAIFDSLVEAYAKKTDDLFKGIAETEMLTGDVLSNMPYIVCRDALVEIVHRVADAYMTDPYIHKFLRLITIEQFNSDEAHAVYQNLLIDDALSFQTSLFSKLMTLGIFNQCDPEIAALHFYAPIHLLISQYDPEHSDKKLIYAKLERHVRQFAALYEKGGR